MDEFDCIKKDGQDTITSFYSVRPTESSGEYELVVETIIEEKQVKWITFYSQKKVKQNL